VLIGWVATRLLGRQAGVSWRIHWAESVREQGSCIACAPAFRFRRAPPPLAVRVQLAQGPAELDFPVGGLGSGLVLIAMASSAYRAGRMARLSLQGH